MPLFPSTSVIAAKDPIGERTVVEKVATLSELPTDRGLRVEIADKKILLVRDGDAVRAYSAVCPHAQAPLEEGAICNGRIVCPWHKATFRVSDGALLEPPALDGLARYPVGVDGEDVFVEAAEIEAPKPIAPPEQRTYLIVGAGAAGAAAAAALREFGFGGRILLVGGEPGLPFDRTCLSKFVVAGQMPSSEIPPLLPEEFYQAHAIERIEAEISRLDVTRREAILADGRRLTFDSALIATGGVPTPVEIPGAKLAGVHMLRNREDASAILADVRPGARAVILGSSFIGLEVASSLREQKARVSVVSPDAAPFVRQFGTRIGQSFRVLHEAHGVEFHSRTRAAKLEGNTRVEAVVLEDGRRLPADLVVVGVGVRPAADFIEGVEREKDGGLRVDASMRVAADVYAAGDIAAFPLPADGTSTRIEHWRVAQQQARVAAANMRGGSAVYDGVPFFWTYHYGQNFEYLGHAETWDEEVVVGEIERQDFAALLLRRKQVAAVVACGRQRTTAALAERMREPLPVEEALRIIEATSS
jgi:NADPH-dependent 2,4-dienoyl-CoA reductase/sulfur reductase-like enzyme/nitrite reductase/ring-hydroxylating ferredoxin subunit